MGTISGRQQSKPKHKTGVVGRGTKKCGVEGQQRQWQVWASARWRRVAELAKGTAVTTRQRKEGIENGRGCQGETTRLSEREHRSAIERKVVAGVEAGVGDHDDGGVEKDGGSTKNQQTPASLEGDIAEFREPQRRQICRPETAAAAMPSQP